MYMCVNTWNPQTIKKKMPMAYLPPAHPPVRRSALLGEPRSHLAVNTWARWVWEPNLSPIEYL